MAVSGVVSPATGMVLDEEETRQKTEAEKGSFWQTIFSVLGTFDLYALGVAAATTGSSGAASAIRGGNDPLLRSRRELVVQIFRLVDYPENLQISVAALHAIADMSESSVFAASNPHSPHKLYSILEAAGELPSVMESFIRRLEREETEQLSLVTCDGSFYKRIENEEEGFLEAFGLTNLVRLQILDFLIKNAAKPGYNLAHYLLGFSTELLNGPATVLPVITTATLASTDDSLACRFTCLHLILELLAFGLGHPSSPIVALDHPSLGHKCYELLVALASNPLTRTAMLNYLQEHEDFYRKQLAFFARTPVDSRDIGYTIFEILQKSALFKGVLLDLYKAVSEGNWSNVKKSTSLLVKGTLESSEKSKDKKPSSSINNSNSNFPSAATLDSGQSLISVHLGETIDAVLTDEYLSALSSHIQEQLLFSMGSLLRSAGKVSQLILACLDKAPYDKKAMVNFQSQLITSLIPLITKLHSNPNASGSMLEASAILSTCIMGYLGKAQESHSNNSSLAGDEMISLVSSSLMGIIRSDSTLVSRSYLYATFIQAVTCADAETRQKIQQLLKVPGVDKRPSATIEVSRLIEVSSDDSVIPSKDANGWKTVACSFLNSLLVVLDKRGGGSSLMAIEKFIKLGYLKSLIGALRNEDKSLVDKFDPYRDGNGVFLWQSRFALLERMLLIEVGMGEKLLENGLFDTISGLRVLEAFPIIKHGGEPLVISVLQLLALIANCVQTPAVRSALYAIITHSGAFESLLLNESERIVRPIVSMLSGSSENASICKAFQVGIVSALEKYHTDKEIVEGCLECVLAMVSRGEITDSPIRFGGGNTEGGKDRITYTLMIKVLETFSGASGNNNDSQRENDLSFDLLEKALALVAISVDRQSALVGAGQRSDQLTHFSLLCAPSLELVSAAVGKNKEEHVFLDHLIADLRSKLP